MKAVLDLRDDLSEKVRYDYSEYPIYIRHAFLSSYPNYAAPIHFHDDLEFIIVLSGTMKYNVNGEIVVLNKGEGIIINARQLHCGFSDDEMECEFLCILLHPILLCFSYSFENEYVIPFISTSNIAYIKLNAETVWQKTVYRELQTIYEVRGSQTASLKILLSFLKIWDLLLDNTSSVNTAKRMPSADLSVLKNMVGYIQKNYGEKITLSDIAAAGAVGQSKCCKIFGRYLGQTPGAYLNHYRLEESVKLLQNSNLSVTEIACAVGFGGASYYAEAFRKWAGKSPREYRRLHKQ